MRADLLGGGGLHGVLIALCLGGFPPKLSIRAGRWKFIRTFRNLQENLSTSEQYFQKFQERDLRHKKCHREGNEVERAN